MTMTITITIAIAAAFTATYVALLVTTTDYYDQSPLLLLPLLLAIL